MKINGKQLLKVPDAKYATAGWSGWALKALGMASPVVKSVRHGSSDRSLCGVGVGVRHHRCGLMEVVAQTMMWPAPG
jgi:hypothetical protein